MKQSIGFSQFCDGFHNMDRNDNFTYCGKKVLFDYLEEHEITCDEEIEFDVIALCCEFSEDDWSDIASNYSIDLSDCEDDEEKIDAVRDYLSDNTSLCGESSDGVFVYAEF